jgi:HD-like signal output (HDOD) protein
MFEVIRSWFRRCAKVEVAKVAPAIREREPAPVLTMTDMLREKLDELGGPSKAIEVDVWMDIATAVRAEAHGEPRPPTSFPAVATKILAMLKNPLLDVNELVGAVHRDAAITATLLKYANSAQFAPAVSVANLRSAIQLVGTREVAELVLGAAGRSLYDIPTAGELAQYPTLWRSTFHDAIANAFTAARIALDVRGAQPDRALFAGLLVDVGRPITMRVLGRRYRTPALDEPTVSAVLDELAFEVGGTTIRAMGLPDELARACMPDAESPSAESQIARLISNIGAIQRRSPRAWGNASEVRKRAEALQLSPAVVRTLFAMRAQYRDQASQLFG